MERGEREHRFTFRAGRIVGVVMQVVGVDEKAVPAGRVDQTKRPRSSRCGPGSGTGFTPDDASAFNSAGMFV